MTNSEAIEMIRNDMKLHHDYLSGEYRKALGMAVNALEAQQWIPVSERLPEDGQDVLFCDIDNDVMKGYHVKGRPKTHFSQDGTYEDIKNVIAWMPSPKPYKAERAEDG